MILTFSDQFDLFVTNGLEPGDSEGLDWIIPEYHPDLYPRSDMRPLSEPWTWEVRYRGWWTIHDWMIADGFTQTKERYARS